MPGLLTLKTDLKSLKYGHDTPGGGDSGQPYIKTDINSIDATINRVRLTKFDDGLIRGGIIGATNAAVTDTLRIGKFLTDFPKGPLFIVKQVGLQLTNPRVESSTLPANRPTSGQGAVTNVINFISNTANKIENAVGPTRIYNLGINTLAQVPVNAIGGHIVRHGFLPNNDDSKYYENVIKKKNFPPNLQDNNSNNRLLDLTNNFNLGPWGANKPGLNKKEQGIMDKLKGLASASPYGAVAFGALNAVFNTNKELEIDSYLGGANSVYGIGVTTIRRAMDGDTENKEKIDFARAQSVALAGKTRDDKNQPVEVEFGLDRLLGASNYASSSLGRFYFNTNQSAIVNDDDYIPINLKDRRASILDPSKANRVATGNNEVDISKPSIYYGLAIGGTTGSSLDGLNRLNLPNTVFTSGSNKISDIVRTVNNLSTNNPISPNVGIYAQLVSGQNNNSPSASLGRLPNSQQTPVYKNAYGDTVVIAAAGATEWNTLTREKRVGSGRQDLINLTPIFTASAGTHADTVTIKGIPYNINDLVKFRIQAINSNAPTAAKWMIFRAYITDLSDNVDATWNGIKYAGRGDQFYIYEGFTRKMSVTFQVASLSRQEMEPMYQKLNFLMSNLMPDYSTESSSQGLLMKGPIMRMTIGNWIDGQLCVLNSLSYKVPQDSPWEIGLGDQELILPHIVEVTLGFTPIGSQTRDKNELSRKADCVSNIAQNWNVGKGDKREYIVPCNDPAPPKPVKQDPVPDPIPDPDPVPPKKKITEIPPAYDQTTGTALQGINNPGKEPKFGSPGQERAYLKKVLGVN